MLPTLCDLLPSATACPSPPSTHTRAQTRHRLHRRRLPTPADRILRHNHPRIRPHPRKTSPPSWATHTRQVPLVPTLALASATRRLVRTTDPSDIVFLQTPAGFESGPTNSSLGLSSRLSFPASLYDTATSVKLEDESYLVCSFPYPASIYCTLT